MLDIVKCKESFEIVKRLQEVLKPTAQKNKISSEALVLLISVYCENCIVELMKNEYLEELINYSFVEKDGDSVKLTGKGAILAKSLERVIK